MYRSKHNNVEYCPSLPGGKASRPMFGLARDNNMNGSTFGAWNVELRYRECSPSLKGGLVDLRGGHRNDEPRHSFGKPAYSAYNITAGSKRRNIRQPNSKSINS
uniref:Uncharacterized protein n=2 Tax=Physcomitrium patens TaxID=3218 RepID=A0A7I3ZX14_PHYPA